MGNVLLLQLLDLGVVLLQAGVDVGGAGAGRRHLLLQSGVLVDLLLDLLLADRGVGLRGRVGLRQVRRVLPLQLLQLSKPDQLSQA